MHSLLMMKIEHSGPRPTMSRRTSKLHKQVIQTIALITLDALHGEGILYDHPMEEELTRTWFTDESR